MNPWEYDERIWIHCRRQYLQLAICRTHTCLSRGYNLRSIGQARVREILEKEKRFSIIFYYLHLSGKQMEKRAGVLLGRIFTLYYREYRRWDRSGHKRWAQLSRVSLPPSHSWRRCPASKLWTGPWEWDSWVCLGYKRLSATFIEKWRIGWSTVMWICRFTRSATNQKNVKWKASI